jgi:hypothetical protein
MTGHEHEPVILSTGQPSTLRVWRELIVAIFGPDTIQAKFLDDKITKQGEDEEVIADERQFLFLLASLESTKPVGDDAEGDHPSV